jgi:hypothetical protein
VGLTLLGIALGVLIQGIPKEPDVDSVSYQLMAAGRMDQVVDPYSTRVLHPFAVRALAGLMGGDESEVLREQAFLWLACGSLLLFVWMLSMLAREKQSLISQLALFISPSLCLFFINRYLPDLFVNALVGLLFVLLFRGRFGWALLVLFLLQLARESTYLLTFAWLISAFLSQKDMRYAATAVLVTLFGMVSVAYLSREAQPNIHGLSTIQYLASKVVANGLVNIFGITPWSDTYALRLPHYYPDPPLWKMTLSSAVALGGVKEIGIYSFDGHLPLKLLCTGVTTVGILPLLFFRTRIAEYRKQFLRWPLAIQVALFSGLLYLLLAPFSGRSIERLFGYAWPLWCFVLPWVLATQKFKYATVLEKRSFFLIHSCSCWGPIILSRIFHAHGALYYGLVCLVVVACYWFGWRSVRKSMGCGGLAPLSDARPTYAKDSTYASTFAKATADKTADRPAAR